jgi:hypothetical protein
MGGFSLYKEGLGVVKFTVEPKKILLMKERE